jgi:hypothetical protein
MNFNDIEYIQYDTEVCWFDISENMQRLSKSMRNDLDDSHSKKNVISLFDNMFHIINKYDLDMNKAWDKWHKKACTKKYVSL